MPSVTLLSRTSGVLPTRLIIESWNCTICLRVLREYAASLEPVRPIPNRPPPASRQSARTRPRQALGPFKAEVSLSEHVAPHARRGNNKVMYGFRDVYECTHVRK